MALPIRPNDPITYNLDGVDIKIKRPSILDLSKAQSLTEDKTELTMEIIWSAMKDLNDESVVTHDNFIEWASDIQNTAKLAELAKAVGLVTAPEDKKKLEELNSDLDDDFLAIMYIIKETGWSYEYVTSFQVEDINNLVSALNMLNDPDRMKARGQRVTNKAQFLNSMREYPIDIEKK